MTNLERSLSQGDAKPFELRLTNGELAALLAAIEVVLAVEKTSTSPQLQWLASAHTKLRADLATRV